MPRTQRADYLMTNRFHLIDVSLSLPPVLLPIFSFSSITAPELILEMKEVKEGNFEYPRKIMQSASVNNVILARGAILQDNDFWVWIDNYSRGMRGKKNLLLVQSSNIATDVGQEGPQVLGQQVVTGFASVFEMVLKSPGRAWILRNCSPVRYKVASDFDASQGAVSIQELEIAYEFFIDFNTGII